MRDNETQVIFLLPNLDNINFLSWIAKIVWKEILIQKQRVSFVQI